jgi:hypothetical protein
VNENERELWNRRFLTGKGRERERMMITGIGSNGINADYLRQDMMMKKEEDESRL